MDTNLFFSYILVKLKGPLFINADPVSPHISWITLRHFHLHNFLFFQTWSMIWCIWVYPCFSVASPPYCTSFRKETLRLIVTFLYSLSWMSQGYHSIEENDSLHEWPQRFLRIHSHGFSALTNLGLDCWVEIYIIVMLICHLHWFIFVVANIIYHYIYIMDFIPRKSVKVISKVKCVVNVSNWVEILI